MAKDKNGRIKIPTGTIVVIIVILAGLIGQWYLFGDDISENKDSIEVMDEHHFKELTEMDDEGCKPARANETNIAVINTKLDRVQVDVKEMRVEQTTRHTELMKAIREK